MKSIDNDIQAEPSMVAWLDDVRLTDRDRGMAKGYLRRSEAVLDLIWFAGARIRAIFVRGSAICTPAGTGLSTRKPAVDQLP